MDSSLLRRIVIVQGKEFHLTIINRIMVTIIIITTNKHRSKTVHPSQDPTTTKPTSCRKTQI